MSGGIERTQLIAPNFVLTSPLQMRARRGAVCYAFVHGGCVSSVDGSLTNVPVVLPLPEQGARGRHYRCVLICADH
jgi:hypothetical protein